MKAKLRILLIFLFISSALSAQNVPIVDVPDEIEFAGMKLKVTASAKEILRKKIDSMTKSAKYFYSRVELANLYFPLIDKVFEEESFPKDFKYLALQESSLIGDAISKSNAVGYWQFKKESAIEVGLRVDANIDERMNIISSSRGAARYFKRNNLTFNNWIYSLQSYYMGLGGAKAVVDQSYIGATKMTIDENTHWYIMTFLAHKLVYQNAIEKSATVDSVLVQYINGAHKSIQDIADEFSLDKDKQAPYNKWLKSTIIPEDKIYPVVLVVPMSQARVFETRPSSTDSAKNKGSEKPKKEKFPSIDEIDLKKFGSLSYTLIINGTKAILARNGDNSVKLSAKGNITKSEFLEYNEMKSFEDIMPGKIYYLEHKRKKAMVMFHTVQYGESIWDIAQNYGIKIETIREKNRMDENEAIDPGRVLWLRTKRPKGKMVEYKAIEKREPVKVTIEEVVQPVPEVVKPEVKKEENVIKTNENIFVQYDTKPHPYIIDSVNNIYTYHTVITGETLFGISRKYQVTTDSLMRWNSMPDYKIKLGQILIVNAKPKVETPVVPLYHTVVTGDTFYKIARQYNVSVPELQQINNKTDMGLKIGEKLLIPKR